MERWQAEQMVGLPLEIKIQKTKQRIREFAEEMDGEIYVAFSGGKDSTVLLDIARSIYPDTPAAFCDTGLEWPEIRQFVKTIDNVVWLKPKLTFKQTIEKYGYPIISKEQSQYIYQYRHAKSEKTKNTRLNGNRWGMGKIADKWKFLIDEPFMISDKCCNIMKKDPSKRYEKKTGKHPIIGTVAGESKHRMTNWMKYGCNAFDLKRPTSRPLSFWTDEDVWDYIKENKLPYSKIYDMGYERTGCMFCMFGLHLEDEPNRFQLMEKTHPELHNYCINKLGCGEVLDKIHVSYCDKQQSMWEELEETK